MLLTLRPYFPAALVATASLCIAVTLHAAAWKPITPEDLAATARLDPETGIEILLREVTIDDAEFDRTTFRHYIRLKVFNERGVASLDKIELPEADDWRVERIAARVIRPDGTIVPIDSKSIYTTEVLRRGSFKVRVKAFTFPALEPGCLVEYQFNEVALDQAGILYGLKLRFQQKWPTWVVRFRLYPNALLASVFQLQTIMRNHTGPVPKPDVTGCFLFEKRDVPALKEEPWMPPDDLVESSILFYYVRNLTKQDEYWKMVAQDTATYVSKRSKPDRTVEAKAKELIAGAADDTERLRRLHDFCRTKITNVYSDTSGMTPEQIDKLKENRSAASTLARGSGTGFDINMLFLSLASASGYHARVARAGDRSEGFFDARITVHFSLPDFVAAVKVGETWAFCDPGSRYLPFGTLSWRNQGQQLLICDAKRHEFVLLPETPASDSRLTRRASLQLDEEGTLSGTVTLEYTGHVNVSRKNGYDDETPESAAEIVRDDVHERLGTAEITDVVVTNAADPIEPIRISYKVRVPEYAERTGRRMVFQPAYFQKGASALFKAETRDFDLYTAYSFAEEDIVEIALPPGFQLEEAAAPASRSAEGALRHKVVIGATKSGRKLLYRRAYVVGSVYFAQEEYAKIKLLHDQIHESDQHLLVIKRIDDAPAADAAAPVP